MKRASALYLLSRHSVWVARFIYAYLKFVTLTIISLAFPLALYKIVLFAYFVENDFNYNSEWCRNKKIYEALQYQRFRFGLYRLYLKKMVC